MGRLLFLSLDPEDDCVSLQVLSSSSLMRDELVATGELRLSDSLKAGVAQSDAGAGTLDVTVKLEPAGRLKLGISYLDSVRHPEFFAALLNGQTAHQGQQAVLRVFSAYRRLRMKEGGSSDDNGGELYITVEPLPSASGVRHEKEKEKDKEKKGKAGGSGKPLPDSSLGLSLKGALQRGEISLEDYRRVHCAGIEWTVDARAHARDGGAVRASATAKVKAVAKAEVRVKAKARATQQQPAEQPFLRSANSSDEDGEDGGKNKVKDSDGDAAQKRKGGGGILSWLFGRGKGAATETAAVKVGNQESNASVLASGGADR
eukprot:g1056.t1